MSSGFMEEGGVDQTDCKHSMLQGVGGGRRDGGRRGRKADVSPVGQPGFGDAFNSVRVTSGKESFLFIMSVSLRTWGLE